MIIYRIKVICTVCHALRAVNIKALYHIHRTVVIKYTSPCGIAGVIFSPVHGAQTGVGNRELYHESKAVCGKREEKITTEYENLVSVLCFVNEFPKTKRRKYPQYTSE